VNQPAEPQPPLARSVDFGAGARGDQSARSPLAFPLVTYTMLGVTIGIFLIQEALKMGMNRELFLAINKAVLGEEIFTLLANNGWADNLLLMLGARIDPLIVMGQYWRLITPVLLHPTWFHILINMFTLYSFGRIVEQYYGHGRFFTLYFLGALGGNIAGFLFANMSASGSGSSIGAMVAAFVIFVHRNRTLFGERANLLIRNILIMLAINLSLGMLPMVENWSLVGGLLTGLAFAWFATPLIHIEWTQGELRFVDRRKRVSVWAAGGVIAALFVLAAGAAVMVERIAMVRAAVP
jgi:rhomboid protease GluP